MDTKYVFDAADIEKNKGVAAICNVPMLFWLYFVAAKDSDFARFYCNQGFWLLMCTIVSSVISSIPIIGFLGWLINVAVVVFIIIGILAAAKGEAKEIPFLGSIEIFK